jgi:hypothetical protein
MAVNMYKYLEAIVSFCLNMQCLVPPKMKTELNNHEGVQGTDLYISCAADGLPAPTYTFYKVCFCCC